MIGSDEQSNGPLARVAHILDGYRVVINRGARDGVILNEEFIVFGHGVNIRDPATGEDLGPLEVVRGRGKVTHLQNAVATLTTSLVRNEPIIDLFGATGPGRTRHVMAEFSKVEVGDFARPTRD